MCFRVFVEAQKREKGGLLNLWGEYSIFSERSLCGGGGGGVCLRAKGLLEKEEGIYGV